VLPDHQEKEKKMSVEKKMRGVVVGKEPVFVVPEVEVEVEGRRAKKDRG